MPEIYSDEELRRMGDVNGDGIICMKDMEIFKAAYGSTPGSPNWNPACDLNGDGVVNLKDITIATANYGKISTTYFVMHSMWAAAPLGVGIVLLAIGKPK